MFSYILHTRLFYFCKPNIGKTFTVAEIHFLYLSQRFNRGEKRWTEEFSWGTRFKSEMNMYGCVQLSGAVTVGVYDVTWVHAVWFVCVCMRLFVVSNSLIPQHVPETFNRCLWRICTHKQTRRRKHIALLSLVSIPVHCAGCSWWRLNRRSVGARFSEQTKEWFGLDSQ